MSGERWTIWRHGGAWPGRIWHVGAGPDDRPIESVEVVPAADLLSLEVELCRCVECGHTQAEPNWCHECGHRTSQPPWAERLLGELEAAKEADEKADVKLEQLRSSVTALADEMRLWALIGGEKVADRLAALPGLEEQ